jgi:chromosome condensin MukBEF ATPase and DNA-binding subunit MukB
MSAQSDQSESDALRGALAAVVAEYERLRDALREIRDADPVDMALDPYWAARVARLAFDEGGSS